MVVHGDAKGVIPEHWQDCTSIQFVEDTIVHELPQFDSKRLTGYQIFLTEPLVFDKVRIVGQTVCQRKIIRVVKDDPVLDSALGHEIVHALQNCQAKLPLDPQWTDEWWAEDHADWYREGVFEAIEKARLP